MLRMEKSYQTQASSEHDSSADLSQVNRGMIAIVILGVVGGVVASHLIFALILYAIHKLREIRERRLQRSSDIEMESMVAWSETDRPLPHLPTMTLTPPEPALVL
jgi:hypothetical protein